MEVGGSQETEELGRELEPVDVDVDTENMKEIMAVNAGARACSSGLVFRPNLEMYTYST